MEDTDWVGEHSESRRVKSILKEETFGRDGEAPTRGGWDTMGCPGKSGVVSEGSSATRTGPGSD